MLVTRRKIGSLMATVCLLNVLSSCTEKNEMENVDVKSTKMTNTTVNSVSAPSTNSNFSGALGICKLQSSYETPASSIQTISYNIPGLIKPDYFYLNSNNKMVMISSVGESQRTELRHLSKNAF